MTGQEIPGDLPPEQVPQMIVITFDDAVNHNNYEEIERFLNSNLKNPNSCDIKTTFFVSHQYNNYSMVQVYCYIIKHFGYIPRCPRIPN